MSLSVRMCDAFDTEGRLDFDVFCCALGCDVKCSGGATFGGGGRKELGGSLNVTPFPCLCMATFILRLCIAHSEMAESDGAALPVLVFWYSRFPFTC